MGELGRWSAGGRRFESLAERLVREAQERGEFDNLPGAGKPLKSINGRQDPDWWIRSLIERENLEPLLPTALSLRKEVERLPEKLSDVRREREVREIVEDLNARIVEARWRPTDGPRILVKRVDVEQAVKTWRDRRRA